MKSLINFFQDKQSNIEKDEIEIEEILKSMTTDEEKEVMQALDLPKGVELKEAMSQTLKNFKDPDSELGICFGTVRLKTNAGEVVGTVRVKEGEAEGTIRYIGTVRIKDGKETIESESQVPEWADFGFQSVRIVRDEYDYGTVKCSAIRDDVAFTYRPPEPWEISILALEKGEFDPLMKEEAFGKYKKKRRGVNNLFVEQKKTGKPIVKRSTTDPEKNKGIDEFADLKNLLGNTDFDSSGSFQLNSSDEKKDQNAELKRSLSSETKKKNAIEKTDSGSGKTDADYPVGSGKERAWAKWRKENTDI